MWYDLTTTKNADGSITFISCASADGGYFYVLKPDGSVLGQVDIPRNSCRTDTIAASYFSQPGTYIAKVADYNNFTWVSQTIQITAAGTGSSPQPTVRKELVTNLTSNETIIKAALYMTGSASDYVYVSKYQEAGNWVFVFDVKQYPGQTPFIMLGTGAGLVNFISANWRSIATVLVSLGVVSIIWMWRDVQTKASEATATLSTNANTEISGILANAGLTAAQKSAAIEAVLQAQVAGSNAAKPTDWMTVVGLAIAGIIAVTLLQSGILTGGKR